MNKSFFLYCFSSLFILSWWTLAFYEKTVPKEPHPVKSFHSPSRPLFLSPLSREKIQQGLKGDLQVILSLLQEWQVDADLLEMSGRKSVKTLSKEKYLKALSIGRELAVSEESLKGRFLPQTYAAASILLAICPLETIVAIPKGVRDLTHLYPKSLTNKIPLNAERDFSEKLYLKKPTLAFVSNYSHPATLTALKEQGINLLTLSSLETLEEIIETIGEVGRVTDYPLKAKLLQIFVEATFLAIDNRIEIPPPEKVLFLTHMNAFSLPGKRTLTGQLLTRMGISSWGPEKLLEEKKNEWSIPLTLEQIGNYKAESLIISTFQEESLKNRFETEKPFENFPKNRCFVDEVVQTFPSQFIALAYFDLVEAYLKTQGVSL
jgi:iron complex transport system substrate-binding protein